jgi:hypothetical protein
MKYEVPRPRSRPAVGTNFTPSPSTQITSGGAPHESKPRSIDFTPATTSPLRFHTSFPASGTAKYVQPLGASTE